MLKSSRATHKPCQMKFYQIDTKTDSSSLSTCHKLIEIELTQELWFVIIQIGVMLFTLRMLYAIFQQTDKFGKTKACF
jgi:hypothetical protein